MKRKNMKDQNRKLSPNQSHPTNRTKPKDSTTHNFVKNRQNSRNSRSNTTKVGAEKSFKKKPAIKEIVREPTSGGIVVRYNRQKNDIEILLIQDSKNRWTIPKGHIEAGETAKQTAIREIGEEAGLNHIKVLSWLGKIHFKYRRVDKLVLMTTQIYLVRAMDGNERPTKEKWMNGIKWFSFRDALNAIEYDDIEKLMLIAKKRIRTGEL